MKQSDIEVLEVDGVTIAVLGIEYDNLDEEHLTAASDRLLSLAKTIDPPKLVFDLSRTRFFASGFLGVVFRVWNRLSQRGGTIAMCCASGVCVDVLRVTNVEKLWGIYETQQEAIEALSGK
ncbi:MAG: STAS domain-containing protein [Planctomycetota bacterium]|nr:STAS domain-containing protein [Planctomycetota bacterium]